MLTSARKPRPLFLLSIPSPHLGLQQKVSRGELSAPHKEVGGGRRNPKATARTRQAVDSSRFRTLQLLSRGFPTQCLQHYSREISPGFLLCPSLPFSFVKALAVQVPPPLGFKISRDFCSNEVFRWQQKRVFLGHVSISVWCCRHLRFGGAAGC